MSDNTRLQQIVRSILEAPEQAIRYVSGAVTRIFSPTDDQYPKTGVQPFEGDPPDRKSRQDNF
ncbi:MAG: hypothetical protein VKJ46_01730 [Leptolyngbyaceae bacterium]|nr:hypothetical protein [Leptolyngbyaceae bacterium]